MPAKYSKGPCDICHDVTILTRLNLFDARYELCIMCCRELVVSIQSRRQTWNKRAKRQAGLEYEAQQLESEEVDIDG